MKDKNLHYITTIESNRYGLTIEEVSRLKTKKIEDVKENRYLSDEEIKVKKIDKFKNMDAAINTLKKQLNGKMRDFRYITPTTIELYFFD